MRRSSLLTLTALGALVCLIGGTGIFAALNDTARTGTNSIDSAPLAGSADIQLATAIADPAQPIACGPFSENLTTGWFTASNVSPGYTTGAVVFCIRNVGSQSVALAALVDDLTDLDVACTGDEALHGDASCGDNLQGELSGVLNLTYVVVPCDGTLPGGTARSNTSLKANAMAADPVLGTLVAGATGCFMVEVTYPSEIAGMQQAQSDSTTWRFAFTAAS